MTVERVGPYRLLRRIGQGGMGVVWAAEDERLGRTVAIKTLVSAADEAARERLWREARTSASVSHPNVCQLFDVIEQDGELYLAMELLEGESLAERLERDRPSVDEAVATTRGVLAALAALHARGVVHRDLKPSNVFLTAHGVKVLDFGLALPVADLRLTSPGMIMGTPQYMAPEQWRGEDVTASTDLFAAGGLLFEMLAGNPAFGGKTVAAVCQAVLFERPPALTGSPRIDALGRIVERALAKEPRERWPSAEVMAEALGATARDGDATRRIARDEGASGAAGSVRVEAVRRAVVLPFRLLRSDPEVDFLGFALADAITVALGGIPSLVLRSPLAAAGLGPAPDLPALARGLEVDSVLSGTILAAGGRVRLSAQLVAAPQGTVLATVTAESSLADVFQLQDELTSAVVAALSLRLSPQQAERLHAVRPGGQAYELYLRANEQGATLTSTARLAMARDLYREAVAEDPGFAPAWARLGRIHRVMGKYGHDDPERARDLAREAFETAFRLAPDLPLAHDLYTYFELEELAAAPQAVERLLGRVRAGDAGPEIYSGLVVACRFCGLLEASLAAHREARRRDPAARSSVHYTLLLAGELERAAAEDRDQLPAVRLSALAMLGRAEEAKAEWEGIRRRDLHGHEALLVDTFLGAIDRRSDVVRRGGEELLASGFHDPDGLYFWGRAIVFGGAADIGLDIVERAVTGGFHFAGIADDPWLESLRDDPRFRRAVDTALAGHRRARERFESAGGPFLLGLPDAGPEA